MTHLQTRPSGGERPRSPALRDEPSHRLPRALQIAGLAALGLGAAIVVGRLAQARDPGLPRDSAPIRSQRSRFGTDTVVSTAITVHGTPEVVLAALDTAIGKGLAQGMIGAPESQLHRVPHDTPDVLSWRTEDGSTLVKLMLRPARGGRMTAITGIVSVEDAGVLTRLGSALGKGPHIALKHALTEFRMRFETGETARAR